MSTLKPIAEWTTYTEARQAVTEALPRDYEINRRLIEHEDHWQEGKLWPGHRTGDKVVDAALRERIQPQFVADDVAGELVENRTNGLVGQEADIRLEPIDEPADDAATEMLQEEADAILADLAWWWDQKKFWPLVADATDRVSYAKRGAVRPFIADGNLTSTPATGQEPATRRLPSNKTRRQALSLVDLEAPVPHMAVLYLEPTTQRPAAIVLGKVRTQDRAEVWTVDAATGKTEVRVFVQGGTAPLPLPLDLGGRLPFGEMRGRRIITDPLRRTQALLNFIMTVTGRTVETAGFRERYIINAEPELLWLTSAPAFTPVVKMQKNDAGQVVGWGVRMPRTLGAGILSEIQGLEIPNPNPADGQNITTPSVEALDPVDPAFATNAADAVTARLYKRAKQGHLGLAKTGETSGTAYQQARAQFESDLKRLKSPAEGMIRDVLEGALAFAGLMSTEAAGILGRFRLVVNLHLSPGPVTPEDATTAITLRDAGAISTQTMQARVGVEDPAAEQSQIDADPVVRATRWKTIAEALSALMAIPDMTLDAAGFLLGLEEQQLEVLRTGQIPADDPAAPKLVA